MHIATIKTIFVCLFAPLNELAGLWQLTSFIHLIYNFWDHHHYKVVSTLKFHFFILFYFASLLSIL